MYIRKPALFNFWYRLFMKWPASLTIIRHDISKYNILKQMKAKDPRYQAFVREFERDPYSALTQELARQMQEIYALPYSDQNTPLVEVNSPRAVETARNLAAISVVPDVIFIAPYLRTKQTYNAFILGWPELCSVPFYFEERVGEQRHGLSELYNDWRVFHALHPDQKKLYDQVGSYWYQYPQGENRPMVRDRVRSFNTTITRDFRNKHVMVFSHHLYLLCQMANLERWDAEEFERVDHEDKPINCGVTRYVGVPNLGRNGKFKLDYYNRDLSGLVTV